MAKWQNGSQRVSQAVVKMLQNYTLNSETWQHPMAKQWPQTAASAMHLSKASQTKQPGKTNNNRTCWPAPAGFNLVSQANQPLPVFQFKPPTHRHAQRNIHMHIATGKCDP